MLVLYKYVWDFSQRVFQQTDLLDLPILLGCRISRLTITLHNFLYTISCMEIFDIELLPLATGKPHTQMSRPQTQKANYITEGDLEC